MQRYRFDVDAVHEKKRLDVFLAEVQTELTRSRLRKLIDQERVTVNGSPCRAGTRLRAGDQV
ncbi:MAG: RluA family pseudouridine synthase, partial [Nitrospinaceae bacterium]|nr:RluA family pseudouridine synthase [Nitrospinaceae bacterium]NIS86816.1 RluA family pseudouridine synthase [Nitrospinaceae bacterium]NIT83652.1 RluA family pseudouridine synthase [Nitrospinaceae bacterium]NIU98009.1 RluA family pseudouridine synthase [Nitrospinaceae bacterium]NIY17016.1 RluA family pseudouridine synthase [Nitrospinaceae bacterium]